MFEITNKPYKKGLLIALILILFLSTVGLGPLSINLYQSEINKVEAGTNYASGFDFNQHSYLINIYFQNKQVGAQRYEILSETPNDNFNEIVIEAFTENPEYSGNYFLPFYKDYTVKYTCKIGDKVAIETGDKNASFNSKVEGTLKIKIIGLCTISNAKKIANDAIVDSVNHFITNQLNNPTRE